MSILKPCVLVIMLNHWNKICFCLVYLNSSHFLFRSLGSRSCCRISTFFQSWFYFGCFSTWIKHSKIYWFSLDAVLTVWSVWQWMQKLWQICLNHLLVFIKNIFLIFCLYSVLSVMKIHFSGKWANMNTSFYQNQC